MAKSGRPIRILHRSLWLPVFVVTVLVAAVFASVAYAQSNTYTYANNLSTQIGQERFSGELATLSGGSVNVILAMGHQTITSYFSHPGYTEIASQTADTSLVNTLYHARTPTAHSKCRFNVPNVSGGTAPLTCKAFL